MRVIRCIGYENYVCGKIIEGATNRQKRCLSCAVENERKRATERSRKFRQEHLEIKRERDKVWCQKHPEIKSVSHHWHHVFNPKRKPHKNYVGMPFFDAWNPSKGGSFKAGANWIIANLGKRPEGCSLHIVNHAEGFVPGNLEWASPKKQAAQQMFKIIADQRHEIAKLKQKIQELELWQQTNSLTLSQKN